MRIKAKSGRKPTPYIATWGEVVPNLRWRAHDKRWIVADGRTFVEADERQAVARAREMMGTETAEQVYERLQGSRERPMRPAQMWATVAREIRARPQWVAEQTGIEQIGYLWNLKPPTPLPTLDALADFWRANGKGSAGYVRKVERSWADFRAVSAVAGLRDISRQVVADYERAVVARGSSGKQQSHLINGIRRVLTFYKKKKAEGDALTATNDALAALASFELSESAKNLDPKPIDVPAWRALLNAAEGDDRAMILLMLNGAFYIGEVIDLKWEDIADGCIVTKRKKTGRCIRVCQLWKETLDALAAVERKGASIFYTYAGLPIKVSGAQRRFTVLASKAKADVTASQLRDGAYTAAAAANVSQQICRLLVGHSCGMADHYVQRQPQMVAPACDAIYRHYFAQQGQ